MRLFKNCTPLLTVLIAIVPSFCRAGISGTVVDQQQRPVIGATVLLLDDSTTVTGTAADDSGRFELDVVVKTPLVLRVSAVNFEPSRLLLDPGDLQHSFAVVLREKVQKLGAITVTPNNDLRTAVLRLNRRQIRTRARQSLIPTNPVAAIRQPLIAREGTSLSSRIRINGSSPTYYLNGINLGADPDHYGVFSIVPASALNRIRFSPQGTDASFGSPTTLEMQTGAAFDKHRTGDLSLSTLELTAGSSLGSKQFFLTGVIRQSILDKLADQINIHSDRAVIPPTSFTDLFLSGGRRLSGHWNFFVDQYAVHDYLAYNTGAITGGDGVATEQETSQSLVAVRLSGLYEHLLLSSVIAWRSLFEDYYAHDRLRPEGIQLNLSASRRELLSRHLLKLLFGATELSLGSEAQFIAGRNTRLEQQNWNFLPPFASTDNPYIYQSALNTEFSHYEADRPEFNTAEFVSVTHHDNTAQVTAGARLEHFSALARSTALTWRARLGITLTAHQTLALSAGTYAENPSGNILEPYQVLVQASLDSLRPIFTRLVSLEYTYGAFYTAIFYKQIRNLPLPTPDFSRVTSQPSKIAPGFLTMRSNSTASFSGLALSADLPHFITDRLTAYVSYAYTRASRQAGGIAVPYNLEAPHRFVGQLDYRVGHSFSFGAELQARSGYPYSPLRTQPYPCGVDCYSWQYYQQQLSNENSLRFPAHVQLNFHAGLDLDRTSVFLSVANITNRANPIINSASGLIHDTGILPSLVVTYRF